MRMPSLVVVALVLALAALTGCGGDTAVGGPKFSADSGGGGDATVDAGGDAGQDVGGGDVGGGDVGGGDVGGDAVDDATADTGADTTADAGDDTTADAGDDSTPDDAGGDDAGGDTTPVACSSDADCKGKVTLEICHVEVCSAGTCTLGAAAKGTLCDDGSACTDNDGCDGGSCTGDAKKCDDGNPCSDDACDDASGKCAAVPGQDGDACDDGDKCSDKDACKEGKCVGSAVVCDDNNACTDDACAADSGCSHVDNDKPCGDTDKCFGGGTCKAGACSKGTAIACDDGNPCTDDACDSGTGTCKYSNNTAACDDGDKCTTGDVCAAGACKPAKATSCDDNNPCTDDGCDKSTGQCAHNAKVAGVACDDGDVCTEGDQCNSSATCKAGSPKTCNDANPCTDDGCDAKSGCTKANNKVPCSDGKCKLGTCDAGACKLGDKAGCDDGNVCTSDACDSKSNTCVYTPVLDGTVCVDGNACINKSLCSKGQCQKGGAVDCGDGNPCTTDSCEAGVGCKWGANTAPCDDGDKCTSGDVCKNGACAKGTPIDVAKACNDNNICTSDACDPKTGCTNTANTAPCDDNNVCTEGDVCAGGKCAGASDKKCDDDKPCTNDICDAKSGGCSWVANTGACDDGNACTDKDVCFAGKCEGNPKACDDNSACTTDTCDAKAGCVFTPVADSAKQACDDGSKCTKDDVCVGGACKGGGAPACDDGNACTSDSCDAQSGDCTFLPNSAGCDTGDLCTFGDACKNGKCVTGSKQSCDDGTTCTTDSCDAKTGACKFTPVSNGTTCSDGFACTSKEACQDGKCVAGDSSACAVFSDSFDCAAAGKGWQLDKPQGKSVVWAVDQTAKVGSDFFGCNLNLNNGSNYCDSTGQGCQTPTGNATSAVIDGSKLKSAARIRFNVYYDLDMCGGASTDRPQVQLLAETGNTVLYSWIMQKSGNLPNSNTPFSKAWRLETRVVNEVKGQKFRIRFNLFNPNGACGNGGTGYYVDNLIIDDQIGPEVCGDGVDNDGNGQVDCADVVCKGKGACVEACDDGIDNDFDDAVDCKDADCEDAVACKTEVVLAQDFDCGATGWNFAAVGNLVKWAIDGTPAAVTPHSGKCTLNFNNGTNLCNTASCSQGNDNAAAGTASWGGKINASGYKKVYATYWSYMDTEVSSNYDRGWLQATTNNYAACCGATNLCDPPGPNNTTYNICNTDGTGTYLAPGAAGDMKVWQQVTVDLSKFAGKTFDFRFRFNTGDGQNNAGAGWFVDDLRILGEK